MMKKPGSHFQLTSLLPLMSFRWLPPIILAILLVFISYHNYLLFHVLAEFFTIIVAILVTVVIWQTYSLSHNHYLMFLGCGYFWVATLDFVHTLVYKGMAIYPIIDANPATQFWISARYFEALLLLSAPFFINRSFNRHITIFLFGLIALGLYLLILSGSFPVAFIEDYGLTRFKIVSEYVIIGLLIAALVHVRLKRRLIGQRILVLISFSIIFTIFAELAFTFYVSVYGLSNLVGHIFKLFSFWLIFEAVVSTTLKEPIRLMNKNLLYEIKQHKEAEEKLSLLLNSTAEAIYGIDTKGLCTFVNPSCIRILGYDNENELIGQNMHNLIHHTKQDGSDNRLEKCRIYQAFQMEKGTHADNEIFWRKDESSFPAEYWSYPVHKDSKVIGAVVTFFDITQQKLLEADRKQTQQVLQLRQQLVELVYTGDQDGLMRAALDAGEAMTDSRIGFFHFVKNDQENLSLQIWSTRTLKEMCFAEGNGLHYPVSEAGVWVDCIHQRQPVIHNDYNSLPHKKGLPDGHPTLHRELTVPVFRHDKIVAVVGVGNKVTDYTQQDLDILNQISDMAFDYVERIQAEAKVEFMAYYDVLTSQPNRHLFADRMKQAIAISRRSKQLLGICYLDLDRFKPINDRYGHHIGDALLIEISQRISEGLREGDTLARLGGDEFAILLCGLTTTHECEEVIQRILDQIKIPLEIEGHRLYVTGSIGITLFPTDDSEPDTLLRHADQAMYLAKESGQYHYQLYHPVQATKLDTQRQNLEQFEQALHQGQLILYYQPKIDLSHGDVVGVEALIRWQHPEKGLQHPAQFLPLIENSPVEISMGEWVVKSALEQLSEWQKQGISLTLSINISPRHMQLGNFVEFMTEVLARYPNSITSNLELEVLETVAVGDTQQVTEMMNACKDLGVSFALDDFGTGYSSLTHFHRLPIDVLKIDQNFVRDMLDESGDLDIVEGVLKMAKTLNRPVVAEGVETVEIGLMLLGLGCQYAQGYGIARPMSAERIQNWLIAWQDDNIWHQLQKETQRGSNNFALDVAIFSHRYWLDTVKKYIHGVTEIKLPPLDESQCQFGHWYKGIGKIRFGTRPVYPFISPKHTNMHEMAKSLVTLVDENKRELALSQLEQLEALSEEFISILQRLSDE